MTVATRLTAAAVAALICVVAPAAQAQSQRGQQQVDLQSALRLRPDQQAAYHAYETVGPTPDEVGKARAMQDSGALRTPERLDRISAYLTSQLAVFQRKARAARAFYNVLSPDQQHTFDEITAPPPHGGGQSRGGPQGGR